MPPPDTVDGDAVSQVRSSLTDQLHELLPDTVTLRLSADAPKLADDGDTKEARAGTGRAAARRARRGTPAAVGPAHARFATAQTAEPCGGSSAGPQAEPAAPGRRPAATRVQHGGSTQVAQSRNARLQSDRIRDMGR